MIISRSAAGGTWILASTAPFSMPPRRAPTLDPADRKQFAALRDSNLKTSRAWALKEAMMAFFGYTYERPARKHFLWWRNWAVRSRLQPMIEKARMLKRRFENIVTYLRHPVTNAASDPSIPKIQWVKYTARGSRLASQNS